jgi:hypothetical protein
MVENIGGGLPVIPRFRISSDCATQVLLSAFLRQPVIPVGHHQDMVAGLDLLEVVSLSINQLGPVVWSDMQGIARANYCTRLRGGCLQVRMHSRRISVPVDKGVTEVSFLPAWGGGDEIEATTQSVNQSDVGWMRLHPDEPALSVSGKTFVHARLTSADPISPEQVSSPTFELWPIARRLMKESYDRLQPCWRGLGAGRSARTKESS